MGSYPGARRPGGRAIGRTLARRSPPPRRDAPPSAPAAPPPPPSSTADPAVPSHLRQARWRRGPTSAARPTTPSPARLKRALHSTYDNGRRWCHRVRGGERLSLSLSLSLSLQKKCWGVFCERRKKGINSRKFFFLEGIRETFWNWGLCCWSKEIRSWAGLSV